MYEDWQMIYSTPLMYQAELVRAVLKGFDIESILLNRKDSAYLFGEIEIFVQPDDVLRAKQIINREKL